MASDHVFTICGADQGDRSGEEIGYQLVDAGNPSNFKRSGNLVFDFQQSFALAAGTYQLDFSREDVRETFANEFRSRRAANVDFSLVAKSEAGAVPEPATWGMTIVGFGGVGSAMRRRKQTFRFPPNLRH